jgi:dienelactone hydrolase
MQVQEIILNEDRNVRFTAYIQDVGGEFSFTRRPAILILPGGGYSMCSDREADPVAMPYLKGGFQVFILRYTVKQFGGWPNPLNDYEQAMSLIKERAEEWNVQTDKIAVIGFSAGGHLAACAATIAENKPNVAILVYPAILKDIVDMCQPGMPYPADKVNRETCPCYIVSARDDNIVPIQNTLEFATALADHGIAFETCIYSYGKHGFSTAENHLNPPYICSRLPRWVNDSIEWMGEIMGKFTSAGFTDPIYPANLNADVAPELSVWCTLGHIRKQSDEVQMLLEGLYSALRTVALEKKLDYDVLVTAMQASTVRELMQMIQIPDEEIDRLDKNLKKIEPQ